MVDEKKKRGYTLSFCAVGLVTATARGGVSCVVVSFDDELAGAADDDVAVGCWRRRSGRWRVNICDDRLK